MVVQLSPYPKEAASVCRNFYSVWFGLVWLDGSGRDESYVRTKSVNMVESDFVHGVWSWFPSKSFISACRLCHSCFGMTDKIELSHKPLAIGLLQLFNAVLGQFQVFLFHQVLPGSQVYCWLIVMHWPQVLLFADSLCLWKVPFFVCLAGGIHFAAAVVTIGGCLYRGYNKNLKIYDYCWVQFEHDLYAPTFVGPHEY